MQELENQSLQEENLVREISFNLSRATGWMKFLGATMIIYGGMIALSIVGIVIAWLPIWMGLLLIKAAQKAKTATNTGNKLLLNSALQNINNYFTISGILLILGLLVSVLVLLLMVLTGFTLENLNDLMV